MVVAIGQLHLPWVLELLANKTRLSYLLSFDQGNSRITSGVADSQAAPLNCLQYAQLWRKQMTIDRLLTFYRNPDLLVPLTSKYWIEEHMSD